MHLSVQLTPIFRESFPARKCAVCWFVILALVTIFGAQNTIADEIMPYEITFDATWSATTHPQDFPSGAHFSGLIGGTHNDNVRFWEIGQLASAGIEVMAETGGKTTLVGEIQAEIDTGDAFSVISGSGLGSPGTIAEEFSVSSTHSLVTLVSMIAPSPDWFVGVSAFDLRPGGVWLDHAVVQLLPYDSGTDSGPTFTSPNDNTNPADSISEIVGYPFTDTPPLGTFTFRLVPEPSSVALLLSCTGIVVSACLFRRRRG